MSRTVVERLSRVVDRRASRRGFLSRSAMGATAMAVAPTAYALRPTTAEAAICNCRGSNCDCGALCCDGYTDFCCFIHGENLCPPGTMVAGWWKADGAGFCDVGGASKPRYYLDCNLTCDDGCGCGASGICASSCTTANCGCADGCNSRGKDCTRFRYGQCNQDTECLGAIACRIITCVPPWEWDPSCSTASRTDNNTRFHDRPCLHDGFTDVSPNAFYTEAVEWMIAEGITTGLTDDLFGPHETADRAQFGTFVWRYEGSPSAPSTDQFTDVADGQYYTRAVDWLWAEGLTTGTSANEFSPFSSVTRAETVTFLYRLAGEPEAPDDTLEDDPPEDFDDVDPDAWYGPAVAWARRLGITTGVTPTTFEPDRALTRAECATFLFRYDEQVGRTVPVDPDPETLPDPAPDADADDA